MKPEVSLFQRSLPAVPVMSLIDPIHAPIPFLEDPFYYYPTIYTWVFQVFPFLFSPPEPCMHLASTPYLLHALPISIFFI
jgi:hypothetical protein